MDTALHLGTETDARRSRPRAGSVANRVVTKRGLIIAFSVVLTVVGALFAATKLAVRHERLPLFDMARNRSVPVDLYLRRDKEMKAMAGLEVLPVAIISHGNTVASSEYSFLANMFAARGYLVASVQHDLPTDPPLSMKGYPYVGRLQNYERGTANIDFVIGQLRQSYPIADYDHLTLVGHSNGGDISVFYASSHPETVTTVVTLDNLRVPLEFVRAKLLSFRSRGGNFRPDAGVVPAREDGQDDGTEVVMTGAPHNDLSDRGPEDVKGKIANELGKFLDDTKPSKKKPTTTMQYAPGAPY